MEIKKKTILVTGANGQLGNEMRVIAAQYPDCQFLFVTRDELSIDDLAAVKNYFDQHAIDYCVNCAAYTAVDKAETETEKAMLINGTAVGNLAQVCSAHQAQFIHISTDYVFDGTATTPYPVDFPVAPVNWYGATKLRGEQEAVKNNPSSIIIRTSWVYSSFGNNFVKTMLRLMGERDQISVVSDQQGCPTYAADLAEAIMQIIASNKAESGAGIYHYSNAGVTDWWQFAVAIKDLSGSHCTVLPIPSSSYPTPAKRPAYSVMDTSSIQQAFDITIPFWKDSLQTCLHLMGK